MFRLFFREEQGATLVEYSIMVVSIAAVCILIVTTLGTDVKGLFQNMVDAPW